MMNLKGIIESLAKSMVIKDYVNQFERVTGYERAILPERKTAQSAGYDLCAYDAGEVKPGETVLVKTGIKAKIKYGEYLQLHLRSSVGIKHSIMLANGTGIIDGDYYNNKDNEGHIMIPIRNIGNKTFKWKRNARLAQLIFMQYDVTIVDDACRRREGGFGSTGTI